MANDQLTIIVEKLDSIEQRLGSVEQNMTTKTELATLDTKITVLNNKIMPKEELETHFGAINETFQDLQPGDLKRMKIVSENLLQLVDSRGQDYKDLKRRVDVLEQTIKGFESVFRKLSVRNA